jgi:hypothetical protein
MYDFIISIMCFISFGMIAYCIGSCTDVVIIYIGFALLDNRSKYGNTLHRYPTSRVAYMFQNVVIYAQPQDPDNSYTCVGGSKTGSSVWLYLNTEPRHSTHVKSGTSFPAYSQLAHINVLS